MNRKQVKDFLKSLKKLDPIIIEWVDAEGDPSGGWQDLNAPMTESHVTAKTVGFYLGHSKTLLRTFSDIDLSNGTGNMRNDIQLSNVKSVKVLNVLD